MASPNARIIALRESRLYSVLPNHLRQPWIDHTLALGDKTTRPGSQEKFESEVDCLQRLNAWGFATGCAFVTLRSRPKDITPSWQFACVFHDEATANKWKLEGRVEKDDEGNVVSKRQRDTVNRRLGCPVRYGLSFRQLRRGQGERAYIGRWIEEGHLGHPEIVNPFSLPPIRANLPMLQHSKANALTYRMASLPYSEAVKLLRADSLGMVLSQQEYYNLIRRQPFKKEDNHSAIVLLKALEDEGFKFRVLTSNEVAESDPAQVVSVKIVQIVFWCEDGVRQIQRFCAGALLVADATFNTNSQRMPLMTSIGLTNEKKRIPVAFSYAPGETKDCYRFFLDVIHEDILDGNRPDVILVDQSAGFTAAAKSGSLADDQQLQYCNWHQQAAMIRHFRDTGGYTSDEIEVLKNKAWLYIQSPTLDDLTANRQALIDSLHPKDQEYVCGLQGKESLFVECYTKEYANLEANSTQTLESFHNVVHQVTHGQMSLKLSAQSLAARLKDEYTKIADLESRAQVESVTGLDTDIFKELRCQISLFAIRRIEDEVLKLTNPAVNTDGGDTCKCETRLRLKLPCRHQLLPLRQGFRAIPLGMVHPRWWLFGPVPSADWKPTWGQKQLLISPKKRSAVASWKEVMNIYEVLNDEGRARFERQIQAEHDKLRQIGISHQRLEALPMNLPDAVPKKTWTKPSLKAKPTKDGRILTANEAQDKLEMQARKEKTRREKDQAVIQRRQHIPQSPELPSLPMLESSPSPSPGPVSLPLPSESTAPPAIEGARPKRPRAKSGFYSALNKGDSRETREKKARR